MPGRRVLAWEIHKLRSKPGGPLGLGLLGPPAPAGKGQGGCDGGAVSRALGELYGAATNIEGLAINARFMGRPAETNELDRLSNRLEEHAAEVRAAARVIEANARAAGALR